MSGSWPSLPARVNRSDAVRTYNMGVLLSRKAIASTGRVRSNIVGGALETPRMLLMDGLPFKTAAATRAIDPPRSWRS